jgi:hypothetical protein
MTILIGNTQAPEETEEYFCKEFKGLGTHAIVGPFGSAEQASDWLEFMKARNEDSKEVPVPSPDSAGNCWYGFLFEMIETKPH